MKVSIKQISEITGFSPATVCNALNYKRGVNEETAAVIRKTAQELGYMDSSRISRVKFVMFKRTGTIVEDTPFFPALISGAERECRANGMELIMSDLDKRDANYQEQARWLLSDKASAVILLGTELMDEDIDLIRGMRSPFVVIDYFSTVYPFDSVMSTNADSARTAVEYLIGKGHKEIGYLRGDFRIKPFRSRASGYRAAMQKAALPVRDYYTVTVASNMDGAYEDMDAYLGKAPRLPTAFFADNDIIALGAMKAMSKHGIRIPDDVSIIGFDDLTYSSISSPPLTTLRVPKQELGQTAVRRLCDIIKDSGDSPKLKIQLCTEFIERDSVKAI